MCINTIILLVKAHIFLDAYFFAVRAIRRCMHLTTSRYDIVSTTLSTSVYDVTYCHCIPTCHEYAYLSRVTRCTYLHAIECLAHDAIVHHAAYLLFCRDFLTNLMCGALESYSGRFTPMAACPTPLWWVLGTDTYAQCEQHCNKVTYFCIALADFFCDDCVIRIWNKVWIRHFSGAPPLWCSTAYVRTYVRT